VHYVDVIRWCLGQDSPRSVTAIGGRYAGIQDNREIPDTLEVLWEYDGPTLVVFEQYNANAAPGTNRDAEMELRGTKGTMYIRYASWEVVPEKNAQAPEGYDGGKGYGNPLNRAGGRRVGASLKPAIEPKSRPGPSEYDTTSHASNFLDCIKSRGKCNADVLTGHISTSAALIGNIAHKTGSHLQWDAKAERFTNNDPANERLHYEYRAPYKLG